MHLYNHYFNLINHFIKSSGFPRCHNLFFVIYAKFCALPAAAVLRTEMVIPDPGYRSASKIVTQIFVSKLRKYVPGCSSRIRIRIFSHSGSRIRISNTGTGRTLCCFRHSRLKLKFVKFMLPKENQNWNRVSYCKYSALDRERHSLCVKGIMECRRADTA